MDRLVPEFNRIFNWLMQDMVLTVLGMSACRNKVRMSVMERGRPYNYSL